MIPRIRSATRTSINVKPRSVRRGAILRAACGVGVGGVTLVPVAPVLVTPAGPEPAVPVTAAPLVAGVGVLPCVQSTALDPPGAASAVPKKLVDSAKGFPLVLASPA